MTGPPPDRMTHALPRMRVAARRPPRGQQQRPETADDAMRGKRTSRFSQPALALVTGPASCDDKPPRNHYLLITITSESCRFMQFLDQRDKNPPPPPPS